MSQWNSEPNWAEEDEWASTPVLHITNFAGEHYHMHVRIEDGALVMGSRNEYIVLSQADAANFAAAFASYASTGTFS